MVYKGYSVLIGLMAVITSERMICSSTNRLFFAPIMSATDNSSEISGVIASDGNPDMTSGCETEHSDIDFELKEDFFKGIDEENQTCTEGQLGLNGSLWANETGHRPPGSLRHISWRMKLKIICVPFFTLVGLFGNGLSFIVLFSPVYHKKSYTYYLRALAIFDTLTLLITLILTVNELNYQMTGTGFMESHNWVSCKVTEFLRHVIYLMSSWLVVLFTVDRYIAVCHPLQRARICTASGAIITTLVLCGIAMLSQGYIFSFIERLDRNGDHPCHVPIYFARKNASMEWVEKDTSQRLRYFSLQYFWFSFILRFTLPFVVIAVCNGLIIFHIRRMRYNQKCPHNNLSIRSCYNNQNSKEGERKRNANMAIYTLFLVCSVFVLTLLPNALISMVQFLGYFLKKEKSYGMYKKLLLVNTPFQMIRLVNYSMNFVLYGLTGRQFRREARKLLTCRFKVVNLNEKMRDLVLQQRLVPHRNDQSRL